MSSADDVLFPDSKAISTVHLTGAAAATRRFLRRHIQADNCCETVRRAGQQPFEQPPRRRRRSLSGKALADVGPAFRRQ